MRKPVVDYSRLRPGSVTSPEYRHLLLLSGWLVYFALYFLTEGLIAPERCHVVHCALDDLIPFCEWFVIPYTFWYALIFGSLLYFLLYDVPSFRKLQIFIMITQAAAMAVYILWPSIQLLRPEVFPRENVFTRVLGLIYAFDTPTGVCPSLHVAYSLGIVSVWLKYRDASRLFKAFILFTVAAVCVGVLFVKQHSALDVLWALPLGLAAEAIVYGRDYWLPRWRKGRSEP